MGGRPVSPAPSASSRAGGLFSRAFSSRSISAQTNGDDPAGDGKMKRSTSFTSISSIVKKGSGVFSKDPKGANLEGESASSSISSLY
jgi:predicted nucleic acid-binding Zn ribbon protein